MNKFNEVYKRRINKAIDYVNSNLDRSIPLTELASISFFSPFHFHRIFVAIMGESVNDFTNRMRLEKAAKMLTFSKRAISEIALECGFSSPATLSRSFKDHFGNSPSAYRKNGEIENRKIRKELFPVGQYHCDMDEAELKERFPVLVKEFPQTHIAYIRVPNSFEDGVVIDAFGRLTQWAKRMDLFNTEQMLGMSKDDPTVTPKEKYIYYVGITLPENFKMGPSDSLDTMTLPKCKHAVASVSGDFNTTATAINYLFNLWLVNSHYEPEHQPGLEIFKDNSRVCDWSHFELDLCIPVKEMKTI